MEHVDILVLVVLALTCSVSEAMTCMDAISAMSQMSSVCPENCQEDQDGVCADGKQKRDTDVCGKAVAPECETKLTELFPNKEKVKVLVDGFATCEGEYAAYNSYATMGADFVTYMWLEKVFTECGYESPYERPATNTCIGAADVLSQIDKHCPKNCDGGDLDADGFCPGQKKERDAEICGAKVAPDCKPFLEELIAKEDVIKDVITGMASCTGMFAFYAGVAQGGPAGLLQMINGVMYNCGDGASGGDTTCGAVKAAYQKASCCGNPSGMVTLPNGMPSTCAGTVAGYKEFKCCGKPDMVISLGQS